MKREVLLGFLILVLMLMVAYLVYSNVKLKDEITKISELGNNREAKIEELINNNEYLQKIKNESEHNFKKSREGTYPVEKLESLDLEGIDKLMISTHPDDEFFWGGGHLLEDDYLVVCVTCGMDANRQAEFEKTMSDSNDKYVMLSYPRPVDSALNREFNWKAAAYLTQDLENVVNLKNWSMIVTHNPEGEYGHKYHKLTSQVVTSIVKDKSKLYYFGKFYNYNETYKLSSETLEDSIYKRKVDIINANYKSQWKSAEINSHMFKNENFISYNDWK